MRSKVWPAIAVRIVECRRRALGTAAGELLFQQDFDLGTGQGHVDQTVAEGLHGKTFAVGHVAGAFACLAGFVAQVGAYAARIHEPGDRLAKTRRVGCFQLRIRAHVAQRGLAGRIDGEGDIRSNT